MVGDGNEVGVERRTPAPRAASAPREHAQDVGAWPQRWVRSRAASPARGRASSAGSSTPGAGGKRQARHRGRCRRAKPASNARTASKGGSVAASSRAQVARSTSARAAPSGSRKVLRGQCREEAVPQQAQAPPRSSSGRRVHPAAGRGSPAGPPARPHPTEPSRRRPRLQDHCSSCTSLLRQDKDRSRLTSILTKSINVRRPMWLTAQEALARLGSEAAVALCQRQPRPHPRKVRPGRQPQEASTAPRMSTASQAAAAAAAARNPWRPRRSAGASRCCRSALSTVSGGRLYYRGEDAGGAEQNGHARAGRRAAVGRAVRSSCERSGMADDRPRSAHPALFALSRACCAIAPPSHGRGPTILRQDAAHVFHDHRRCALLGLGSDPVHIRLAARFGRPDAADTLRRALVLLADHELNASTFAARVTVSTGASLAAGALTGLATLSGPLHGACREYRSGISARHRCRSDGTGGGAYATGWAKGGPSQASAIALYPFGDPRAAELLASFEVPARLPRADRRPPTRSSATIPTSISRWRPDCCLRLPADAPLTIFALARSVGWLAHMLEQAASGAVIRPRARYIGPPIRA